MTNFFLYKTDRQTAGNKCGADVEEKIRYLADPVAKRDTNTSEIVLQMSYKCSQMTGRQEETTR